MSLRPSSLGQDHSGQIERLQAAGTEKIFSEKQSGLDKDREQLAEVLNFVREGVIIALILFMGDYVFSSSSRKINIRDAIYSNIAYILYVDPKVH